MSRGEGMLNDPVYDRPGHQVAYLYRMRDNVDFTACTFFIAVMKNMLCTAKLQKRY